MTVLEKAPPFRQHKQQGDAMGMDPCGGAYRLCCSCSWRGPLARTEADAVEAWEQHAHGGWTVIEQAARRRWRNPGRGAAA